MRRFFALLALVALSACGTEIDQSTRPDNLVGDYHLVSYGGTVLPATVRADSVNLQVVEGTLTIAANGEWSDVLSVRVGIGSAAQVQPITTFGTWNIIREAAFMTFYDKSNSYQFTGTASGATIVLNTVKGDQLVYRR